MATTMQLSDLQAAVLQRADMVNSQFIATAELTSYINQSYFELYDLLVSRYGDNYYVQTPYTFQTDGVNYLFPLPTDFYKLLGVDLQVATQPGVWITLKSFEFGERNDSSYSSFQAYYGPTDIQYRINGSNLWLRAGPSTQVPQGGLTIQLWYVPTMTTLVNSTDLVQGVSGWTEYIICDAAMKCLQKQESDVQVLMNEKAALIARIEAMAENRDAGRPPKVVDVQKQNGYGGGGGWDGGW
jgi:hypothetical protein